MIKDLCKNYRRKNNISLNNFVKTIPRNFNKFSIRIDCYYSVLSQFQKANPKSFFENVMRFPFELAKKSSVLSPSPLLLREYQQNKIDFGMFALKFEAEIFKSWKAVKRLKFLKDLSRTTQIFLVCCEKSPKFCHRSILKYFIERLDFFMKKWNIPKNKMR